MAEESPLPLLSDTSSTGLKGRTTIIDDNQDHLPGNDINRQRTVALSPRPHPSPVKLISAFNGVQETGFPTQKTFIFSPKKPKLSPLSQNPLPLSQEMNETELLGDKCKLAQVSDESPHLGRAESRKNSTANKSVEKLVVSGKEFSNIPSVASQAGKPNDASKKVEAEEKNMGLDGFLRKLVKSHFQGLKGDDSTSSLRVEVVDDIALIDFAAMGRRFGKRRERKINPNGRRRRFVYSRTEIEALRFMNVKGQKKFWQGIYYNVSETVKREYDELATFRHQLQAGRRLQNLGMRNYSGQGILGVATARRTWTYPNLVAY